MRAQWDGSSKIAAGLLFSRLCHRAHENFVTNKSVVHPVLAAASLSVISLPFKLEWRKLGGWLFCQGSLSSLFFEIQNLDRAKSQNHRGLFSGRNQQLILIWKILCGNYLRFFEMKSIFYIILPNYATGQLMYRI